ncbi:MAG: hypothetical protein HQ547_01145 [Candidatus Omnitrophica bacterium]|nr:hypothetical protein [Candidatus Omnitrophota bacterium]
MGPIIILDKSAIQSFSKREVSFLFKHYMVVITPILIHEILGDLEKKPKKDSLNKEDIIHLSRKLEGMGKICVEFKHAFYGSLMGANVPMTGQIPLPGGIEIQSKDGEKGVFFEEAPEWKPIRRWKDGIFSDDDKKFAKKWRLSSRAFDLQGLKRSFNRIIKTKTINNPIELALEIESAIGEPSPDKQQLILRSCMNMLRLRRSDRGFILSRWVMSGHKPIREFAPYAFHCYKVCLYFVIGLLTGFITPKPTNIIDIEYLFYLPFCFVFSSGDIFHKKITFLLLRNDQSFIDRDILKSDLRWIANEWDTIKDNKEERENRFYNYGNYPPDNPNSITYQMWKKYMKPRKQGSGNIRMTKEDEERLMQKLKPMTDAIKDYDKQRRINGRR